MDGLIFCISDHSLLCYLVNRYQKTWRKKKKVYLSVLSISISGYLSRAHTPTYFSVQQGRKCRPNYINDIFFLCKKQFLSPKINHLAMNAVESNQTSPHLSTHRTLSTVSSSPETLCSLSFFKPAPTYYSPFQSPTRTSPNSPANSASRNPHPRSYPYLQQSCSAYA